MVCSRYPKEYKHYEKILKRKCFQRLKNNVWECKTKWILTEKADNHYRMKLKYKYINLWLVYLNECYKKKINQRAAESFYEEKLKAKGLAGLKKNVEETWMSVRICKKSLEWNLKYRCWHQWKHYIQKRLKVREIKVLGDRIREERLRIRFFYLWVFRWNEIVSLRDAYETATVAHLKKLKRKYFKLWKRFTSKRICQAQIINLAIACYKDKLKEKYIRCWRRYTFQKKRYRYQVTVIQNFYINFLVKNYLSLWFTAYKRSRRERKSFQNDLAVNFYYKKLLEKSFKTLQKAREMKKVREEAIEKFRDVYVKIYLNLWIGRKTEKVIWNLLQDKATAWRENFLTELYLTKLYKKYQEAIEEREKLQNVIKYCKAITIHRAFQGWCEVVRRKINKKIQLENMEKLYIDRLTNKSFEKWKKYVRRKSRKKISAEYYKDKLLSRSLYLWKLSLIETKQKLEKARNFEQERVKEFSKHIFESWKEEARLSKIKLTKAINFCSNTRLSKAFYIWRKNAGLKTLRKTRYNRNKVILDDIRIKNTIHRLYEVYSLKQSIKKILKEFKSNQDKRLLGFHFKSWLKFVGKMKNVQESVESYFHLRSNILIEQHLLILSEKMKSKKVFNKKYDLARRIEEKILKKRYLKKWLSFMSWKKESISRCRSRDKSFNETFEIFVPVGKTTRRRPMIPEYLKAAFSFEEFQGEDALNQETFRVEHPVNKKLPVIRQNETYASF